MNDSVHVMPGRDLIEHGRAECICGPSVQAVFTEDGSNGWLYIHHALDITIKEQDKK